MHQHPGVVLVAELLIATGVEDVRMPDAVHLRRGAVVDLVVLVRASDGDVLEVLLEELLLFL